MPSWIELTQIEPDESLAHFVGGNPLVVQTLARRGITSVRAARAFLDPDYYRPSAPEQLPGLEQAVERIQQAIADDELICIWGDFDVDGQTATTLLVQTLQDLGGRAMHHIPLRGSESHGIGLPRLKEILALGVQLIVTCDTGTAEHDAIGYAQERGVDVLVSDHHQLADSLPPAYALVNPQMLPTSHPLHTLPGVGVAYKIAERLYEQYDRPEEVRKHLDLAALGIVADVAVLTGDTRYLLQQGLAALRKTSRLGLQALFQTAEVNPATLDEETIGFNIAPRMNALGRLSDANLIVEFLTTEDAGRAAIIAAQLEGLNAERRLLSEQVYQAAQAQIERDASLLQSAALVLSHPKWPGGVIGIVANRLADQYDRPVVLIATPDGQPGRGSARSVGGLDITAAIGEQGELLLQYGGHQMAAGFSLQPDKIAEFGRRLSDTLERMQRSRPEESGLQVDGYLSLAEISIDLIEDLARLGPFGPGNPVLVLASRGVTIQSQRTLGRGRSHLRLVVADQDDTLQEVIWWRGAGQPLPGGRFDLAYSLRVHEFRGERSPQLIWVDARGGEPAELQAAARSIQIIDHRRADQPEKILAALQQTSVLQVWVEGENPRAVQGSDRIGLQPADTLAIWTIPPGPGELREVLERVSPQVVHLFAAAAGADKMQSFLARLAGLIKFAVNHHDGQASVSALAAACAQSETVVRAGIDWLQAKGIFLAQAAAEQMVFSAGSGEPDDSLRDAAGRLQALLEETRAFRRHYLSADQESLIAV